MSDKTLAQLPLAINASGALLYGVQGGTDVAISAELLQQQMPAQGANLVYAGPSGPPGALPSFRRLVVNDIPDLSALYLSSTGGSLVGTTINNSTIIGGSISGTTAVFDDNKFTIRDEVDTTKQAKWEATGITAGTTRTYSLPNESGTLTLNTADQALTNKSVFLKASATTGASLRLPHGVPPLVPVNGDVWTTAGGLYVRIDGTTIGPLAAEQASYVTSFNTRVGAVTLNQSDVTTALGFTPYNPGADAYVQKSGDTMTGPLSVLSDFKTGNQGASGKGLRVTSAAGGIYLDARSNLGSASTTDTFNFRSGANVFSAGASFGDSVAVVGEVASGSSPSSGLGFADRGDYNRKFVWYSSGSTVRLFSNSSGELLTVDLSGRLTPVGGMNINSQGAGGVINFRDSGGTVSRYYSSWDNNSWSVNGMDDGGGYSGTPLRLFRGSNNLNCDGVITANGGFGPGSDPRLKDESSLKNVDNALEKVYNLNVKYGKYHDWYNPDGRERVFLMADKAMQESTPEVFQKDIIERGEDKYNGWSADQMIALLTKAVQELTDNVAELRAALKENKNV